LTLHTLNNYGADFQIKAISSLLTHKEFLTNIHDIINEDFFENSAHRWCIKEILRYYDKYHTTPSLEVLKVELQKVDNDVTNFSANTAIISSASTLSSIVVLTGNNFKY
jgi:hypothetical protein